MRINKYVALATGLSRRAADRLILEGRVEVNGREARLGDAVTDTDEVTLDGKTTRPANRTLTILFHKPIGYVSSRAGQGNRTIYDLLPSQYHKLKPVGRLDKDSSGLLILTNDGALAQQLAHPSFAKAKVYEISLDKPLQPHRQQMISDHGVQLEDGPSRLNLQKRDAAGKQWQVTMTEGRNRQIRRTFDSLGYKVVTLRRTNFGLYRLDDLPPGAYRRV